MNKTIQKSSNPPVPSDLRRRLLRIQADNPDKAIYQGTIAAAVGCTQPAVSIALRSPETVPDVARRVGEYFDLLESQKQSTKSAASVAL